jgi:hypothetical protein
MPYKESEKLRQSVVQNAKAMGELSFASYPEKFFNNSYHV